MEQEFDEVVEKLSPHQPPQQPHQFGPATIQIQRVKGWTTPMVKNIATPTSDPNPLCRVDNLKSAFANARNNAVHDNIKEQPPTIQVGVIHNDRRSPNSEGSPYGVREMGALCQLGGGGYPGGDPEDGPDDGGNYQDRDRNNTYNNEFTLVSQIEIVVPTLSGAQLNSRPYLPFNKAIKKLIKTGGKKDCSYLLY